MSEPMTSGEIEDVLSSIRRLVSEDFRPSRKPASPKSATAPNQEPPKLILTPALRIVPGQEAERTKRPQPLPQDATFFSASTGPRSIWQDDLDMTEAAFHADAIPEPDLSGARVVATIGAAVAQQKQDWEPEDGDTAFDASGPALQWPLTEEAALSAAEAELAAGTAPGEGWSGDDDVQDDQGAPEPEDGVGEEPEQTGTDNDDIAPIEIEDGSDDDGSDDPAQEDWPEPEGDPEADDQSGNDDDSAMDDSAPIGGIFAATPEAEELPVFDDEEDHDEFYEGGADTDMIGTEVRCDIHADDADSDGGEVDTAFDGIEARIGTATPDVISEDDLYVDPTDLNEPLPQFRSERRLNKNWADRAEREVVAEIAATAGATRDVPGFPEGEAYLDEAVLREVVRDLIRAELSGDLGTRITRNVRKLVRAEINLALTAREME